MCQDHAIALTVRTLPSQISWPFADVNLMTPKPWRCPDVKPFKRFIQSHFEIAKFIKAQVQSSKFINEI